MHRRRRRAAAAHRAAPRSGRARREYALPLRHRRHAHRRRRLGPARLRARLHDVHGHPRRARASAPRRHDRSADPAQRLRPSSRPRADRRGNAQRIFEVYRAAPRARNRGRPLSRQARGARDARFPRVAPGDHRVGDGKPRDRRAHQAAARRLVAPLRLRRLRLRRRTSAPSWCASPSRAAKSAPAAGNFSRDEIFVIGDTPQATSPPHTPPARPPSPSRPACTIWRRSKKLAPTRPIPRSNMAGDVLTYDLSSSGMASSKSAHPQPVRSVAPRPRRQDAGARVALRQPARRCQPPFPDGSRSPTSRSAASGAPSESSGSSRASTRPRSATQSGVTPNPTYREVCTGMTGHAEVVRVVYDPKIIALRAAAAPVLGGPRSDAGHAPGQRRKARSIAAAIYTHSEAQREAAEASRDGLSRASSSAPASAPSRPKCSPAPEFYYAEDYHQQYLAKNPDGYCGIGGTGVSCPIGLKT